MVDPNTSEQHEQLRDASIRVLNAIANAEADPETLRNSLTDLHLIVDGNPPITTPEELPGPTLDPARNLLSRLNYRGKTALPVPLEDEAASIRRQLANDRTIEDRTYGPPQNVHLTELQAMIIGSLLRELAARLRPGNAFGPNRTGAGLAAVADGLALELFDQTHIGG